MCGNRTGDYYFKMNLFIGKKKLCSQKQFPQQKSSSSDIKPETRFHLGETNINDVTLCLKIRRLVSFPRKGVKLSQIVFGNDVGGRQEEHWRNVLLHPDTSCAMWHEGHKYSKWSKLCLKNKTLCLAFRIRRFSWNITFFDKIIYCIEWEMFNCKL